MRRLATNFKLFLYVPIAGLLLLFSPLPAQSASAQGMGDMSHNLAGVEAGTVNCAPHGTSSAVNLPEKQKPPVKDQQKDPKPLEQLPLYTQHAQFPEPQKPVTSLICGSLTRPPDLVKLYANFRF